MRTRQRAVTWLALFLSGLAFGGTANISWVPPTQNTDNTPLVDLAGYNIYERCGIAAQAQVASVPVPNTTYQRPIADGTQCWWQITAYNAAGTESAKSNEVNKVMLGATYVTLTWTTQAAPYVAIFTDNTAPQNGTDSTGGPYSGTTHCVNMKQTQPTVNNVAPLTVEGARYAAGDWTTGLCKFDIAVIPATATIVSATFYLYMERAILATTNTTTLTRVRRDWVEAQVTWNVYKNLLNWTTAGAQNTTSDVYASAAASVPVGSVLKFYAFDVKADVTTFIGGGANFGWKLDRSGTQNDNDARTFTSELGANGHRPELVVVYSPP